MIGEWEMIRLEAHAETKDQYSDDLLATNYQPILSKSQYYVFHKNGRARSIVSTRPLEKKGLPILLVWPDRGTFHVRDGILRLQHPDWPTPIDGLCFCVSREGKDRQGQVLSKGDIVLANQQEPIRRFFRTLTITSPSP